MRNKRPQPAVPDKEPRASCPHFDSAIKEIEAARETNAQLREILGQWRDQSEYWETVADDFSWRISELEEWLDEAEAKIKDLEKQIQ
jgi:hypothetical protein